MIPKDTLSPLITGLDLSLTCTGVGFWQGTADAAGPWSIRTETIKPGEKRRGPERLAYIRDALQSLLSLTDFVVIEGYSMGSRHTQAHSAGELGGVVRTLLWDDRRPAILVPPLTLKKFVTGVGKGDKAPVMLHLYKRWGLEIVQPDEADAAGLALYGAHYVGFDGLPLLAEPQRDALKKAEVLIAGGRTPERLAPVSQIRVRSRPPLPYTAPLQRRCKVG